MDIITKKEENNNSLNNLCTLLQVKGIGDLYELFEFGLPYPHIYKRSGDNYIIEWYLDGVFFTKSGIDYINDTLARLLVSFEKITYSTAKTINKNNDYATIKLKSFAMLNSLKKAEFNPNSTKYEDSIFWSLKLFVEFYIRENGFVPFSTLENYAFNHFVDLAKDRGTLKAKCRNIWNYYDARNWETQFQNNYIKKPKEEVMATRSENAKLTNEKRKKETEAKIKSAIVYLNEKEEKLTAKKIADYTKLNKNTLTKYSYLWKK
jgi:hypothetical protein